MNAKANGNGAAKTIEVNPVECARFALMFLQRANFNASERQMFDLADGLLRAIVEGNAVLAPPPQQDATPAPQIDAVQ